LPPHGSQNQNQTNQGGGQTQAQNGKTETPAKPKETPPPMGPDRDANAAQDMCEEFFADDQGYATYHMNGASTGQASVISLFSGWELSHAIPEFGEWEMGSEEEEESPPIPNRANPHIGFNLGWLLLILIVFSFPLSTFGRPQTAPQSHAKTEFSDKTDPPAFYADFVERQAHPRKPTMEDRRNSGKSPFLSTLYPLAAPVHLGLGAVATPTGLAIVTQKTALIPFILHVGVPHWQPPHHRHETFEKICEKGNSRGCPPIKEEVMLPYMSFVKGHHINWGNRNCTQSEAFHAVYDEFVRNMKNQYRHVIDNQLQKHLFRDVCERQHDLCHLRYPAPPGGTDPSGHTREKRFLGPLGVILGLGGLGWSALNSWQMHHMKSTVKEIKAQMTETRYAVNVLREGVEKLNGKVDAVQAYFHEEVQYLWKVMEKVRCQQTLEIDRVANQLVLDRYESYLVASVNAAIQGALSGQLTTEILGPKRLGNLLSAAIPRKNSLLLAEPQLAYKYGKLYPVLTDMDTLTFSYILEVPDVLLRDVVPKFKIYNVGFHRNNEDALYKAPFPETVVINNLGEMVPLLTQYCEDTPGLSYCSPAALDRTGDYNPCLTIFMDQKDTNLSTPASDPAGTYWDAAKRYVAGGMCYQKVMVQSRGYPVTQVIQTPSGALIRSKDNDIHVYREDPLAGSRPPIGHKLKVSTSGVYWLPHVAYRYFIAAGELYTTVTQQTFYFESKAMVQDPPEVLANWTVSPPNPAAYERVVQFDEEFRAAMANMPRPLSLGFHDNDISIGVVALLAISCFAFMCFCLFYRCKQRRDARRRKIAIGQRKRFEEKWEIPPEVLEEIARRLRVKASEVPEYINWEFRAWAQWQAKGLKLIRHELDEDGIPFSSMLLPPAFLTAPPWLSLQVVDTDNRRLQVAIPPTVLFDKEGEQVLFDSRWNFENHYQLAPTAPKNSLKMKNTKSKNSGVVLNHKHSAWGFHYTNINLNSPPLTRSGSPSESAPMLGGPDHPSSCQHQIDVITAWKLQDDFTHPDQGIVQYYVDAHQHVHYIEDGRQGTKDAFNPRPDNRKIQKFYERGT
jgi:hypothetical protein